MSMSAESDENSSDEANNISHNNKAKELLMNNNNNNNNKTQKSQLESKLESLPSTNMRRVSSGHAFQRSGGSRSRLRGSAAGGSNNNNNRRNKMKKILSESSLNTSVSNLGFKPSANANATWDPVDTTTTTTPTTNTNKPKSTKLEKQGHHPMQLLDEPSDHGEEAGDTIAPLLVSRSSAGSRRKANNLLKRAASLKGFGLTKHNKSKEATSADGTETTTTTTATSATTTLDGSTNTKNKARRGLFHKAASISLMGKHHRAKFDYGGFDEMGENSDEFSLHSHGFNQQQQQKSQVPQQQQKPGTTRPTEQLSSLGQSLRRLPDLSPKQKGSSNNNNNNGSSTRFGDSWSVDADYSVASPTLWRENSEEMKPGLQFAPSTVASILTEKMAQQHTQPMQKASTEQAERQAVGDPSSAPNGGQSSSLPTAAATAAMEPISPTPKSDSKPTPAAAATASTNTAAAKSGGDTNNETTSPVPSERRKKLKRTKSKTKGTTKTRKKKGGSSRNVTGDDAGDANDGDLAKDSGHNGKKSKRNGSIARKKRRGGKRKPIVLPGGTDEDAKKGGEGGENEIEEVHLKDETTGSNKADYKNNNESEDDEIQSNDEFQSNDDDEDSDIMSVSDSDYERPKSYSRSNHSERPLSFSKSSRQPEKRKSASKSGHSAFSNPPPAPRSNSRSPKSQGRLSPVAISPKRHMKPPLKAGSLSPRALLAASRKPSTDTTSTDDNLDDSDEESRASRRRNRRSELRETNKLFGSERNLMGTSKKKKTSRRRRSLGGGEGREKGKGYISSFLGAKTPGKFHDLG